jgi:pentatricopeptide repeat protein
VSWLLLLLLLQVSSLFEEMSMSGLSPTLISYNTLLNAYAKLGEWQESLALMNHLCSGYVTVLVTWQPQLAAGSRIPAAFKAGRVTR